MIRRSSHALVIALGSATAAGAVFADTHPAAMGRALFQGREAFAAGQDTTTPPLPAAYVGCVNCHGPRGAGQREGGSDIPPITHAALASRRGEGAGFASDTDILAAIERGMGRNGRMLDAKMPRYRMTPAEGVALLAYLRVIGTPVDLPPGVSADQIRLGTLLPLSGDLAPQGRAALGGMRAAVAVANAAGGVYGRDVVLIAADSMMPAPQDTLLGQGIFAVIGGMWDARDPTIEAALEHAHVPLIASLLLRDGDARPPAWATDLLPPRAVQHRLLASAVANCDVTGPRWLLGTGTASAPGIDRVFQTRAAFSREPMPLGADGCIGVALSDIGASLATIPKGWSRRIGLPFPRSVLSVRDAGIWHTLGQASARIGIEALSVSGAALYEHAPLEALSRLNGFEALPNAPVQFSGQRRYAWDADVLVDDGYDSLGFLETSDAQ